MRLWHKDLLPYLPRAQLISQWRECCCIARSMALNGTPNHILVNRIMDYPPIHFIAYTSLVINEMKARGYKCDPEKYTYWAKRWYYGNQDVIPDKDDVFINWHTNKYAMQNFFNLEEKHDCKGISDEEWHVFCCGYYNTFH